MPIYEYQCNACGHHHEAIQGFDEAPLTKCPACHKPKLVKLLSAPSFHLKGTGWYATDYKKSDKPTESNAKKDATSETTSTTSDKSAPDNSTKE